MGEAVAIQNVEKVLGNAVKSLKEPNLVVVFIGIVLGLALGAIPFSCPGVSTPVKLGLAGGPIIVGILLGTFGPRIHMITYTTRSANLMLRALGLSMYLACLGLDAGAHFFDTVFRPEGLLWIGLGAGLTSGVCGFQDDEDRFRFCIRYVVRKYGKSDGTELCKRYNSRRQPIRSLRDCLSAVYVPAGDYRSSAVNVLVKLRIEN